MCFSSAAAAVAVAELYVAHQSDHQSSVKETRTPEPMLVPYDLTGSD